MSFIRFILFFWCTPRKIRIHGGDRLVGCFWFGRSGRGGRFLFLSYSLGWSFVYGQRQIMRSFTRALAWGCWWSQNLGFLLFLLSCCQSSKFYRLLLFLQSWSCLTWLTPDPSCLQLLTQQSLHHTLLVSFWDADKRLHLLASATKSSSLTLRISSKSILVAEKSTARQSKWSLFHKLPESRTGSSSSFPA